MTQEEKNEYKGKFAERWDEFVAKYPSYTNFHIKEIANYFFEEGREDITNRLWDSLGK